MQQLPNLSSLCTIGMNNEMDFDDDLDMSDAAVGRRKRYADREWAKEKPERLEKLKREKIEEERKHAALAEKEKQAAEFQRIAETEPNNVIISIEESVEDAASTQKTVEEAIEAHQDDPSPFMED